MIEEKLSTITYETFSKVEICAGTIIYVEDFPQAKKPAYKLQIDFGKEKGVKKSSAQITKRYTKEELLGKQVFAVTNFEPRQIGNFMSEVLVLGITVENGEVVLLSTDIVVPNGLKVH